MDARLRLAVVHNDVGVEIWWIEGKEKLCHLRKDGDLKKEMKWEYWAVFVHDKE